MDGYMNWGPLTRALAECSQEVEFSDFDLLETEPLDEGTFVASPHILVMPFARGLPGSKFDMRIWGWWHAGDVNDKTNVVWLPLIVAEFTCTCGIRTGLGRRKLKDGEWLAHDLVLTRGNVGVYGSVVSTGADQIGYVRLDLPGCQKIQFDFQVNPVVPGAHGNCLWISTAVY